MILYCKTFRFWDLYFLVSLFCQKCILPISNWHISQWPENVFAGSLCQYLQAVEKGIWWSCREMYLSVVYVGICRWVAGRSKAWRGDWRCNSSQTSHSVAPPLTSFHPTQLSQYLRQYLQMVFWIATVIWYFILIWDGGCFKLFGRRGKPTWVKFLSDTQRWI